jgi:uncharacterized glyoxalase superfamily protein PhnB
MQEWDSANNARRSTMNCPKGITCMATCNDGYGASSNRLEGTMKIIQFNSLRPMLRTLDLPATIDFYTRVLGFRCIAHEPDVEWASLEREGIGLMLSGPNASEGDTRAHFTGSLYFEVSDVDALWAQVRDRAAVSDELETFDHGMREFAIRDNNGYLLQLGQAVAP